MPIMYDYRFLVVKGFLSLSFYSGLLFLHHLLSFSFLLLLPSLVAQQLFIIRTKWWCYPLFFIFKEINNTKEGIKRSTPCAFASLAWNLLQSISPIHCELLLQWLKHIDSRYMCEYVIISSNNSLGEVFFEVQKVMVLPQQGFQSNVLDGEWLTLWMGLYLGSKLKKIF